MILHCLYDPASPDARHLRDIVAEGDAILLLGAAVAIARREHPDLHAWIATGASLHALAEDLQLHGIDGTDDRVEVLDYSGWVTLAARLAKQARWR